MPAALIGSLTRTFRKTAIASSSLPSLYKASCLRQQIFGFALRRLNRRRLFFNQNYADKILARRLLDTQVYAVSFCDFSIRFQVWHIYYFWSKIGAPDYQNRRQLHRSTFSKAFARRNTLRRRANYLPKPVAIL